MFVSYNDEIRWHCDSFLAWYRKCVSHSHLVFLPGDETIKAVFTFLTVICLVQCFVDYIRLMPSKYSIKSYNWTGDHTICFKRLS